MRRALEAVHADRFVDAMPRGAATPVAERGATLSTGQKQLLSFARALAFDPRILVLDEATSSVDTETEMLIRDALHVLMAGRTTIAIAHRLSTIQDMDTILVLHKGQLRESGSHQELLAQRGIYHRLYQLQYVYFLTGFAAALLTMRTSPLNEASSRNAPPSPNVPRTRWPGPLLGLRPAGRPRLRRRTSTRAAGRS